MQKLIVPFVVGFFLFPVALQSQTVNSTNHDRLVGYNGSSTFNNQNTYKAGIWN